MGPCPWGVSTSGIKADFQKLGVRSVPSPRATSSDAPGAPETGAWRGSSWPPVTGAGLCPSAPVLVAGCPVCNWEGGGISWASHRPGELLAPAVGLGEPGREPDCLNLNVFSLSVSAAFAPFRLFVCHGKYVRFGVRGVLGTKGWQEGQPAPCLGRVPNSCAGTLLTAASLLCSPTAGGGDTHAAVLVGAGGGGSRAGGGHGCYVPFAGRWRAALPGAAFWLEPAAQWLSVNFHLNAGMACFKLKLFECRFTWD